MPRRAKSARQKSIKNRRPADTARKGASRLKKSAVPAVEYPDTHRHEDKDASSFYAGSKQSAASTEPFSKKTKHLNPEKKMSFLEHLEELRWTIFRSIIAILFGMIICYMFNSQIVAFLRKPAPSDLVLVFLGPTEGFMIHLKVAMYAGIVLSLPYIVYEFWKFVVPGLLEKEKKVVPPIVFYTILCFFVGAAFAYFFIIPYAMQFLLSYQNEQLIATITIGKYLGFVVTMILCFGVVFELPVLAFFLTHIGILTPRFLITKRRYGIVVIFIVAAVLTPPDVFTQMAMALPLMILYELSIVVSKIVYESKQHGNKVYGIRPWNVTASCWFYIVAGICGIGLAILHRHAPFNAAAILAFVPLSPAQQFYGLLVSGLIFLISGWLAVYRLHWGRVACLVSLPAFLLVGYFSASVTRIWYILCVAYIASAVLFLLPSANDYYFGLRKRKIK